MDDTKKCKDCEFYGTRVKEKHVAHFCRRMPPTTLVTIQGEIFALYAPVTKNQLICGEFQQGSIIAATMEDFVDLEDVVEEIMGESGNE